MSRVGKRPVPIPSGVTANVEGQTVKMKGPKGQLQFIVHDDVEVKFENGEVKVAPRVKTNRAQAMYGTARAPHQPLADLQPREKWILGLIVALRTGDTSAKDRQALIRRPPDLLITTPESLSLLLSHAAAAEQFKHLDMIVIDDADGADAGPDGVGGAGRYGLHGDRKAAGTGKHRDEEESGRCNPAAACGLRGPVQGRGPDGFQRPRKYEN